ncbi:MAG: hypothetical protein QNJ14_01645 [Woeseiaceae bacterium]|nr:hypothetical protein [Woeseiaceae bacterium]
MNSEVHPAVVAVVLFLTFVAIAIWAWGSGAATAFGGPAELRVDPNGHRYVQIQNYLVEHDERGEFVATHDLEDIGVELFLGTYAFFSNGDILLRRGPDPRSFFDNFRAFQRKTNQDSVAPETSESGLFRCNLDTRHCDRFGLQGVDFKAAHGIYIDWASDDVYISDTTRHLLRKYTRAGDEIATTDEAFKFPNQLMLHDGSLYVADTNHHVIRVLSADNSTYGERLESVDVVPTDASQAKQTWPSHFARVGDTWWVNNMKTGMNLGGLYVFDDSWNFVRQVSLPDGADPISIIALDDEVWVSDWYNDVVRRFAHDGTSLPDLDSAGLAEVLEVSRAERHRYKLYSYGGVALVVFLLLALLVRGFAMSMNKSASSAKQEAADIDAGGAEELFLEPDEKALRRMRSAATLFGALLLMLIGTVAYILVAYDKLEFAVRLVVPVFGFVLIFAAIIWVNKANKGTAIRLVGDTLTLRDHTGRESSCALHQVRYGDAAIATRDMAIFLGRPMAWLYPRKVIESDLLPKLAPATKLNPMAMTRLLIELRHPQGLFTVAMGIAAIIIGIMALVMD